MPPSSAGRTLSSHLRKSYVQYLRGFPAGCRAAVGVAPAGEERQEPLLRRREPRGRRVVGPGEVPEPLDLGGRHPYRGDIVRQYRLGHPGRVVAVVLGREVGRRPRDLGDGRDDAVDAEPGELPLRGEAEVAALVGGERRAREARHPLRDLAPRVAAEPPRHCLARLRVERADGGGPEVYVHSEGGRISRHGSLPTSLRRGCASGTSTTLSQPRPAVTSGGSCRFRAPGLGHSV